MLQNWAVSFIKEWPLESTRSMNRCLENGLLSDHTSRVVRDSLLLYKNAHLFSRMRSCYKDKACSLAQTVRRASAVGTSLSCILCRIPLPKKMGPHVDS